MPAFTLNHGDTVRFIAPTDREFGLTRGETYKVFGSYPKPPIDAHGCRTKDEIAIYVSDPDDNFGGVISRPASEFEKDEPMPEPPTKSGLPPWQIHSDEYCPEEIIGDVDQDGDRVTYTRICTVHGDNPLPIARRIVRGVNYHNELLSCLLAYVEIEESAAPASSSPLRERSRAVIERIRKEGAY